LHTPNQLINEQGIAGLFKAGWTTIKGALVMPLMAQVRALGAHCVLGCCAVHAGVAVRVLLVQTPSPTPPPPPPNPTQPNPCSSQGFKMGLVKFVLITGKKP